MGSLFGRGFESLQLHNRMPAPKGAFFYAGSDTGLPDGGAWVKKMVPKAQAFD
jgi:hypothetical protein